MRKFFPYILILIALIGLFSSVNTAWAESPQDKVKCGPEMTRAECGQYGQAITEVVDYWGTCTMSSNEATRTETMYESECKGLGTFSSTNTTEVSTYTSAATSTKSEFEAEISKNKCILLNPLNKGNLWGCVVETSYYLFYVIPSFFLFVSAYFFNVLIFITLNGTLLSKDFVSEAWGVVRDLSNIFFILILLYIAIKIILGLGGHDVKKMIAKVVVVALLINFSMFFTKIVIDSSNVLALVFYNKLEVNKVDSQGNVRPYPKTGYSEKDAAGALVDAFNPTKLVSQEFLDSARILTVDINGNEVENPSQGRVAPGILIGMIILSGLLMLFASYCLVVAGLSFLGRLIELFVLIIFSPFAFMSSTVPKLEGMEYLGWKNWFDRLITVSFMAPIFMFFLYFIFMLIHSKIFDGLVTATKTKIIESILSIVLPALLILILLLKATEFAKKGSGKFGEIVISSAKLATSLAVGGTALGMAAAGRASVGTFMKGASTGDTAAERMVENRNILGNRNARLMDRIRAGGGLVAGGVQVISGYNAAQNAVGARINRDQHDVEHAAHSRHELDTAAGAVAHGKKWEELNGEQRYQARRQIARDRVVRDNSGAIAAQPGNASFVQGLAALGSRKWESLTTAERDLIDASNAVGDHHGQAVAGGALAQNRTVADDLIREARRKQGIISNVIQSSVTGTYDVRNLANVIAKEQSTGISKALSGLTGLMAGGIRGGFKQMGINTGKAEGKFLQALGSTISESLKNIKISVDLSHVGEVKKEDNHGGGGGGHH